jgi:hypothetical protein
VISESDVWKQFRKTWPLHCERQEPGFIAEAGKPDVLVQDADGVPGFVELKRPDRFKLRPSQETWHERWMKRGRVCVVTCSEHGGAWRVAVWDPEARLLKNVLTGGDAGRMVRAVARVLNLKV